MPVFLASPFAKIDEYVGLNGFSSWAVAVVISGILAISLRFVVRSAVSKINGKAVTGPGLLNIFIDVFSHTTLFVIFIWIFAYAFLPELQGSEHIEHAVHVIVVAASTFQFAMWGIRAVGDWRYNYVAARVDPSSAGAMMLISKLLQAVVVILVVMTGLKHLDVNIGALVAGFGVGGIAVAFAAQNVLGDLLASLSIILDKPFVTGDYIIVGADQGTVDYIGIKSTRVRSLSGELLIFPNRDLIGSRVRNYRDMTERRAVLKFSLPLSLSATPEKINQITSWVPPLVAEDKQLRLDRCSFVAIGSSTLDFELAFFVLSGSSNLYMELQQKLLVRILTKFKSEGIELALPTSVTFTKADLRPPSTPEALRRLDV